MTMTRKREAALRRLSRANIRLDKAHAAYLKARDERNRAMELVRATEPKEG